MTFVVFEGIDGGGKTTLSNLVAGLLRQRGLVVEHVREGGKFASAVTQAMRELGRDARNLAMTPRAELMLYLTREVQLLEEATRPALGRADIVLADRYVYTAETLAVHGRGMELAQVAPLVEAAAAGLWPELAVLVDVDPHVARARRRASKLVAPDAKPPSRKGLAGTALQHRLREGYRALAARDPERWIVVDNTEADLHAMAEALADIVEHTHRAKRRGPFTPPANTPAPLTATDPAAAQAALLAWIDRRSAREPALAAYFLDGVPGPEFDARREALATRAPAVVAAGLRWLDDASAWRLRHALADVSPGQVARSLASPAGARPEAEALLSKLAPLAPLEVAAALWGRDDEVAWRLRAELPGDAAMLSVAAVPGERAWAVRDRWLAGRGGLARIDEVASATVACLGVEAVGDPRAWEVRKAMRQVAPVAALDAVYLLDDERAWKWRERGVVRAPKIVMRSLGQSTDSRAWALRAKVAAHCEETFASILGLDDEAAWALREARAGAWPWAVVRSLGALAAAERGRAMIARALADAPGDVALWRHVAVVQARGDERPR